MSEMIEAVAKAISLGEWSDSDHHWCRLERETWMERARAAIEAMREPGDDIAWAMNDVAIDGPGYVSFYPSFADCKTLFNAAITAALSQDTHSLPSEDR